MNIWDSVPGQDRLKNRLSELVHSGQVSHAYILEGSPSSARISMARGFAQKLLCEKGGGCGECRSCRQIEAGSHLDVISVDHEKPNTISVDDIRHKLIDDMEIRPYQGKYKIYLVDEADKMNMEAQNALLKTLEEPPSYGLILLLTENSRLFLPTILSRAVLLRMQVQENAVLSGEEADPVLSVCKNIWNMDTAAISSAASEWKEKGLDQRKVLSLMRTWFRDILCYKSTGSDALTDLRNEKLAVRDAAGHYSFQQIQKALQAIDRCESRLFLNVNDALVISMMLLECKPQKGFEHITADQFEEYLNPDEEEIRFYAY